MSKSTAPIDLFQGWPSPELLPVELLRKATQSLLSKPNLSTDSLNYGPDPGPDALREELSKFLSDFYSSSWTTASRLTITGGASSGLASILQVYTDPSYTKNVYMVAPTYFLACRIFEDNGFAGRLRAIREDEEGVDLDSLEKQLAQDDSRNGWLDSKPTKQPLPNQKHYKNVLYCVPTFSNPSGRTMTHKRREQLVRLARQYDVLVITDDVYDFLHWNQAHKQRAVMPRLVDIDQNLDGGPVSEFGNTVSNGSFSKILGPGLRTGWTESTSLFAEGLAACGLVRSGGSPSQFTACIIAETLRAGAFHEYLFNNLINTLRTRFYSILDAVEAELLPFGVICDASRNHLDRSGTKYGNRPFQGGYYIYIQLPNSMDAARLAKQAALEANLMIGSGDKFEVKGDEISVPSRSTVRICIARETEERLVLGIKRLAGLLSNATSKQG